MKLPGLEKQEKEVEYLDDFVIDKNEDAFIHQIVERNNKSIEMESIDEINIKGKPIPDKEENEYNQETKETETIEESTTNLRKGYNIGVNKNSSQNYSTIINEITTSRRNIDNMGRFVIKETSKTTTFSTNMGTLDNKGRNEIKKINSNYIITKGRNVDNMGRHVIKETSKTATTTTTIKNGNLDNMGRHVIKETSSSTSTSGKNNKDRNLKNVERHAIKEKSTEKTTRKGGASENGLGNGNMSRKVIIETTINKSGYLSNSASGYSIKKEANKSRNESELGSSDSRLASGSGYYKVKIRKFRDGKKAWDVEESKEDDVFNERHPSDEEELSNGGIAYSKHSSQKEIKNQPSKGGAASIRQKYKRNLQKNINCE